MELWRNHKTYSRTFGLTSISGILYLIFFSIFYNFQKYIDNVQINFINGIVDILIYLMFGIVAFGIWNLKSWGFKVSMFFFSLIYLSYLMDLIIYNNLNLNGNFLFSSLFSILIVIYLYSKRDLFMDN